MRQTLYDDDLAIDFFIDEETDEAYVELESSARGPDLSVEGDVVVALGGDVVDVSVEGPEFARAHLGAWEEIAREDLELMIRVGEWFESWVLELG